MNAFPHSLIVAACLALAAGCVTAPAGAADEHLLLAQSDAGSDDEQLKLAALEGLMSASPERALPLLRKVLAGDHSNEVKSRALFVLSQLDSDEADAILADLAADPQHPLRHDAIRMIGISGAGASLARLPAIYRDGDEETRRAVLNAWLIAGDAEPVYAIAREAGTGDDFNAAVQTLAAMGAVGELRRLADESGGRFEGLSQALAMAGDLEGLRRIVVQARDTQERVGAIRAMGIVGGDDAEAALVEAYRGARDAETRDAALQGLLISGADEDVLELFRSSTDAEEKRRLLQTLVTMNSDLALEVIDATLEGNQP